MRRRFKPYVMLIQRPVFSKFTPFRAFSIKSIEFWTFSSLSNNFGQNPSNFGHFPAKYFGQSPRNPVSYDRIQQNTFRTHSGTKFRTNSACPNYQSVITKDCTVSKITIWSMYNTYTYIPYRQERCKLSSCSIYH